ncbi:hypothetical protein E1263_01540 [Kribbella antibiotica]|uniref:Uncharacterized protein n=1 Tax=Kribbella antibiotica TaxID=190195 RepID=A0A4R4ZY00_9ACTN|nr:hypothetical protein [Kribbella antibiotica]TDD63019.1 hypothetical protein E1263_01540 [Kribbella antibiotica]
MKTLHGKTMLATAMSWVRPTGRREARATTLPVPVNPVVEPAPPMVAKSNNEREVTSYSLIGW